jgi:hypothetical protein
MRRNDLNPEEFANGTVEGVIVDWVDEYNPVLDLGDGSSVYFDLAGFSATENGAEASSHYDSYRVGDRLRVTHVQSIVFLKRGDGPTGEEWCAEEDD